MANRFFSLLLAGLFIVFLYACSSSPDQEEIGSINDPVLDQKVEPAKKSFGDINVFRMLKAKTKTSEVPAPQLAESTKLNSSAKPRNSVISNIPKQALKPLNVDEETDGGDVTGNPNDVQDAELNSIDKRASTYEEANLNGQKENIEDASETFEDNGNAPINETRTKERRLPNR